MVSLVHSWMYIKGAVIVVLAICVAWLGYHMNTGVSREAEIEALRAKYVKPAELMPLIASISRPRQVGSTGHAEVRQILRDKLTSYGFHVEEQVFTQDTIVGEKTFHNIVAYPKVYRETWREKSYVVLSAHTDSKVLEKYGKVFVGACDSAVSVGMIVMMAKGLYEEGFDEDAGTIPLLLLLDGEEAFIEWTDTDSIYGARYMANWMEKEGLIPQLELFILLDLIGTSQTQFKILSSATEGEYRKLMAIERVVDGKQRYFKGERVESVHPYGAIEDDHKPFALMGVPILHLISVPFPSVWHTILDDYYHMDGEVVHDINQIMMIYMQGMLKERG